MNKGLIILLFCYIFLVGRLVAQTVCQNTVEGHVFDFETKEPLPFVTVQIEGTTKGTKTELDGSFKIEDLCDEEFHLVFTHLGYKRTVHHHDPHHPVPFIYLASDKLLLESVVVES
ncbi:MAG: carboxypeptidase-like regulatory domain-containing protein, partial [Bacteroidota bacterium]